MAGSSQAPNRAKKGKGRKKMKMEKMKNKTNLQVTFSKRRSGLFKKVSELCTLTGSEIGVIIFSPGGKVYSFGNPSVEKILDNCFPVEEENDPILTPLVDRQMMCEEWVEETQKAASVVDQNMALSMLEMQIEEEKRRSAVLMAREKEEMAHIGPIEEMREEELMELGASMHALKQRMINFGGSIWV